MQGKMGDCAFIWYRVNDLTWSAHRFIIDRKNGYDIIGIVRMILDLNIICKKVTGERLLCGHKKRADLWFFIWRKLM